MKLDKQTKKILIIGLVVVLLLGVSGELWNLSVLSVSEVKIEPTGNGYLDPATGEWTGDFWFVLMSTDFDDQVTAFMLANDDGTPEGTYAQTGNLQGLSDKTFASSTSSGGNQLVPTSNIMLHITPSRPYYEREMEIQGGYYTKKTYSTITDIGGANRRKGSVSVEATPFIHYSFADVGGGNWILHTPFMVTLYKNGDVVSSREIDTTGGSKVYRLPETGGGNDYINIVDLGKLDTSGYGEPQWDDILYFSENNIFVRSPTADNLLKYDSGIAYSGAGSPGYLPDYINSFSTYWFGNCRWLDDSSPAAFQPPAFTYLDDGDFLGWDTTGTFPYKCEPKQPDVFSNIIPYLQNQGIQKVNLPTGFDGLEKVHYDGDNDGQSENYLRVYFKYGTKSSLVTVKISTTIADTIVWNPQVGNFEFTDYSDFGDVVDIKSHSITVTCVEGAGSARVEFTKSPNAPVSIVPALYTPRLEAGESYVIDFDIQNLGTPSTVDFSIVATVENVLGTVTDTAIMYGRLLEKTGATTIVHVITQDGSKPISNLPVTIYYAGTSQTKYTGLDGLGTVSFNLGTSSDVSVKAEFAGNALYKPVSKTVSVSGGSEKTITLALTKDIVPPSDFDWTWILAGIALSAATLMVYYLWRKRR